MEIDVASIGRAALFLGVPFVLMVFYLQWKWADDCRKNIRVLVAQKAGSGAFMMAPKEGGIISITNPVDKTTRNWPVNELATIDVTYPGVGFVPEFLQKTIRLAIVNEGDMEPMLNRSPHRAKIASPDVIEFLRSVAERSSSAIRDEILAVASTLATGPTRELVADPATLGALRKSSALKALATMGDDLMETLRSLNAKLGRIMGPHPTIVYIGLGLILVLDAYLIYQVTQISNTDVGKLADDIGLIKQALGVK